MPGCDQSPAPSYFTDGETEALRSEASWAEPGTDKRKGFLLGFQVQQESGVRTVWEEADTPYSSLEHRF